MRSQLRLRRALDATSAHWMATTDLESACEQRRADPSLAARHARLGVEAAHRAGNQALLCDAWISLAQSRLMLGRFAPALRALAAALAAAQDDEARRARIDLARVHPLVHLGRYEEAAAAARTAEAAYVASDDTNGRIRAHMALGDIAFRLDRPRAALRAYSLVDRLLPEEPPLRVSAALAANRANAL
ncbi:MAG: hypothetical protein OER88_04240, partial [Planctomycetota bacterium]|nr:hypothetical protein [Planctomycetota bacterium]